MIPAAMRQYGTDSAKRMYFIDYPIDEPNDINFCVAVPDGSKGPYVQDWPEEEALCIFFHGDYDEIPEVLGASGGLRQAAGPEAEGYLPQHLSGGPPTTRTNRSSSRRWLCRWYRMSYEEENRRISCGGFVVSKKVFSPRRDIFQSFKSSERWGSSSCRTLFPGFPHTPFRPVDERFPLFWLAQKPPHLLRRFLSCRKSLFATTRHLSELQKALKDGDHHRAGHPSRVSRTHSSAPLTKGSRSFWLAQKPPHLLRRFVVSKVFSPRRDIFQSFKKL